MSQNDDFISQYSYRDDPPLDTNVERVALLLTHPGQDILGEHPRYQPPSYHIRTRSSLRHHSIHRHSRHNNHQHPHHHNNAITAQSTFSPVRLPISSYTTINNNYSNLWHDSKDSHPTIPPNEVHFEKPQFQYTPEEVIKRDLQQILPEISPVVLEQHTNLLQHNLIEPRSNSNVVLHQSHGILASAADPTPKPGFFDTLFAPKQPKEERYSSSGTQNVKHQIREEEEFKDNSGTSFPPAGKAPPSTLTPTIVLKDNLKAVQDAQKKEKLELEKQKAMEKQKATEQITPIRTQAKPPSALKSNMDRRNGPTHLGSANMASFIPNVNNTDIYQVTISEDHPKFEEIMEQVHANHAIPDPFPQFSAINKEGIKRQDAQQRAEWEANKHLFGSDNGAQPSFFKKRAQSQPPQQEDAESTVEEKKIERAAQSPVSRPALFYRHRLQTRSSKLQNWYYSRLSAQGTPLSKQRALWQRDLKNQKQRFFKIKSNIENYGDQIDPKFIKFAFYLYPQLYSDEYGERVKSNSMVSKDELLHMPSHYLKYRGVPQTHNPYSAEIRQKMGPLLQDAPQSHRAEEYQGLDEAISYSVKPLGNETFFGALTNKAADIVNAGSHLVYRAVDDNFDRTLKQKDVGRDEVKDSNLPLQQDEALYKKKQSSEKQQVPEINKQAPEIKHDPEQLKLQQQHSTFIPAPVNLMDVMNIHPHHSGDINNNGDNTHSFRRFVNHLGDLEDSDQFFKPLTSNESIFDRRPNELRDAAFFVGDDTAQPVLMPKEKQREDKFDEVNEANKTLPSYIVFSK